MGESSQLFLDMIKELYRICRNGAEVEINAPHPRHDDFHNDPTHVRVITPPMLMLFDRQLNDDWQQARVANSPLAHYLHVDFVLDRVNVIGVPEMKGAKLLFGASSTVAGRTSEVNLPRKPRYVGGLDEHGFELIKTDFDTSINYAVLDMWAKFPDFGARLVFGIDRIAVSAPWHRLAIGG